MSKNKITIQVSSQSELFQQKRRTHSIDGALKASTKVESTKGKKSYRRNEFKNPKNW